MTTLPWGIKYRPTTFEEIVGNEDVVNKLLDDKASNNISQRLFITGPTGSGKTTLAYILAEYFTGIPYDPNVESTCVSEINCASENGIDVIRNLIERVRYAPMIGKKQVVILDEVHALTPAAKKALYKPLESESDVVWLLLTNHPHLVDSTIRGRLNQIRLDYPTSDDLFYLAKYIYHKEKIKVFPVKAMEYLSNQAGNVRLFTNALQDFANRKNVSEKEADEALYNALEDTDRDTLGNLIAVLESDYEKVEALNIMEVYTVWAELLSHAVAVQTGMRGKITEPNYFRNLFMGRLRKSRISEKIEVKAGGLLRKLNRGKTLVMQGSCDGVAVFIDMLDAWNDLD